MFLGHGPTGGHVHHTNPRGVRALSRPVTT